jgi:hypothetical protein
VEVTGYPDLARKYHVSSVPKTVVEILEFEAPPEGSAEQLERAPRRHAGVVRDVVGAGPESMLLKHVQEAAGPSEPGA